MGNLFKVTSANQGGAALIRQRPNAKQKVILSSNPTTKKDLRSDSQGVASAIKETTNLLWLISDKTINFIKGLIGFAVLLTLPLAVFLGIRGPAEKMLRRYSYS